MANDKGSDIVEEALNKVLKLQDDSEEGDLLVEWALIAYVDNPNRTLQSGYQMMFSNGNMPDHRARGLYSTALLMLEPIYQAVHGDDDDE